MRLGWRQQPEHEITCQQAVELVMDYLDGRLAADDLRRLETHLTECNPCTEHFKQIRVTIAAAGHVRDEDLEPRARDDLMYVYRRWLGDKTSDRDY